MLAVFSFCHKDSALALKQARWVRELGGVKTHNALVVCNAAAYRAKMHEPILDALSSAFNFVDVFSPVDEIEDGWPQSPNHMWVRTNQFVRDHKGDVPFFWMEPDATPVCADWLDQIENQFKACGQSFLGDWVQIENITPHMSGVGVYHQTWLKVSQFACVEKVAWDVALAALIEPHLYKSKLIQHEWKPASFSTAAELNRIRPEAVIYHQCKDGSLIDRLSESRGGVKVARPIHLGEVAGAHPVPATPSREVDDLKAEIERLKAIIKPAAKQPRGKKMKRTRKPMTSEQLTAARDRLAKAREKKAQLVKA